MIFWRSWERRQIFRLAGIDDSACREPIGRVGQCLAALADQGAQRAWKVCVAFVKATQRAVDFHAEADAAGVLETDEPHFDVPSQIVLSPSAALTRNSIAPIAGVNGNTFLAISCYLEESREMDHQTIFLTAKTQSDAAYVALRDAIVSCRLPAGR